MMKSLLLLATFICGVQVACTNGIPASDVPSIVMNAFKAKFSNATETEWDKEKEWFEAEFVLGNNDHEVKITPEGKITMHKQEVTAGELPEALSAVIHSDYNKYRLDEAEKLEINGKIFYQLAFSGSISEINKVFNASGTEDHTVPYWD
ncbi:MAG TPA: hypothetical protein VGD22_18080 [Sphingobacteriaceae bacterium]